MGTKLIESNFNASKIYRIRESKFDNSPFKYVPNKEFFEDPRDKELKQLDLLSQSGLIDYIDAASLSTDVDKTIKEFITKRKDLVEQPPVPLSGGYPLSFAPTFFDEKSSYLRKFYDEANAEFYPLCNNLCKVSSIENYLISNVDRPEYDTDSIRKIEGILSRNINVSQKGASPSTSENKNVLFYPQGKKCWADCWPGSKSLNNSLFISYDTFEVYNRDSHFESKISLKPNTIYCGSFYVRFYDGSENIDERKHENSINDVLSVQIANLLVTNEGNVSTSWKRFYYVFKTPPSSDASLSGNLKISLKENIEIPEIPVRISGLLIEEQSYPSPYNNISVSYEENDQEDNPSNSNISYSPLAIKSGLLTKDDNWTLMYKKFIEAPDNLNSSFTDIIVGQRIENREVNKEQVIFITHESNSSEIKVKVYDSNGESIGNEETITGILDFSSTEEIDGKEITYNILLGSNSLKCDTYYGYYKDLLIVPKVLEDDEISSILNTFFDVGIRYTDNSYKYSRDGYDIPDRSIPRSPISFEELKSLSSASIGSTYQLSNDSPEESQCDYLKDDILVCIKDFNRELEEQELEFYWSRTPKKGPTEIVEEINDASIFRASNLIEGYIE